MLFRMSDDELINSLEGAFNRYKAQVSVLKKELQEAKSKAYKDKELIEMKKELDQARQELSNGFGITESEHKKINKWITAHEAYHGNNPFRAGACGGAYTYTFTPTGLGTMKTIRCVCGSHLSFGEDFG